MATISRPPTGAPSEVTLAALQATPLMRRASRGVAALVAVGAGGPAVFAMAVAPEVDWSLAATGCVVIIGLVAMFALLPVPALRADERGVTVRRIARTRHIAWSDLDAVAVAGVSSRPRVLVVGTDHSSMVVDVPTGPFGLRPEEFLRFRTRVTSMMGPRPPILLPPETAVPRSAMVLRRGIGARRELVRTAILVAGVGVVGVMAGPWAASACAYGTLTSILQSRVGVSWVRRLRVGVAGIELGGRRSMSSRVMRTAEIERVVALSDRPGASLAVLLTDGEAVLLPAGLRCADPASPTEPGAETAALMNAVLDLGRLPRFRVGPAT